MTRRSVRRLVREDAALADVRVRTRFATMCCSMEESGDETSSAAYLDGFAVSA